MSGGAGMTVEPALAGISLPGGLRCGGCGSPLLVAVAPGHIATVGAVQGDLLALVDTSAAAAPTQAWCSACWPFAAGAITSEAAD